jgi:hypothetical protein
MTISNKCKSKGVAAIFVLVSFTSLAVPCIVLGASRAGDNMAGLRVSSPAREQTHSRVFPHRGFFAASGLPEVEATIEQSQPALPVESEKLPKKTRYVQPRWVDGGYGVEVSEPGYWTDSEK